MSAPSEHQHFPNPNTPGAQQKGAKLLCRDFVRAAKRNLILIAEGLITIVQVLYVFLLTGDFERAFLSNFGRNDSGLETANSTISDVGTSTQIFLLEAQYPETVVVNITIYSFGMTALLFLSVLVWQSDGATVAENDKADSQGCASRLSTLREELRKALPRAIVIILLIMITAVCAAYLSYASRDPVRFLAEVVFLSFVVAMFVFMAVFIGWIVRRQDPKPEANKRLLELETISMQVLFQVYDLVKDVALLVVGRLSIDPIAFGLTLVDVAISLMMIAELYTESDDDVEGWDYLGMIMQYTAYMAFLVAAPPYWLLFSILIFVMLAVGLKTWVSTEYYFSWLVARADKSLATQNAETAGITNETTFAEDTDGV